MRNCALGSRYKLVSIGGSVSLITLTALLAPTGIAFAQDQTPPACLAYDKYNVRGSETPIPSNCDTISPELWGLRKKLTDNGFNFQMVTINGLTYDALQKNGGPQIYTGQDSSYTMFTMGILTYDLGRLGLPQDSQFSAEVHGHHNSFGGDGIDSLFVGQLSATVPLFDNRVQTQFGFYNLGAQFYGTVVGSNIAQSTLGPQSGLLAELGAQGFKPEPAFDARIFTEDKRFYTHLGIGRSITPDGIFTEAEYNDWGLNFSSPNAGVVVLDELGYRVEGPGQRKRWIRAGAVYNTSDYRRLDNPFETEQNYGFYGAADIQLTQPSEQMFFQGWYLNGRVEIAKEDVNPVADTVGLTVYKIGTFESRPFDLVSVGISRSEFSNTLRKTMKAIGVDTEEASTSISASYTARISSGLYLQTGVSYIDNPTFAPKLDNALNVKAAITTVF